MDHPFVQNMMRRKYYGFASDYIRLCSLERHGGLYLDADMEFIRNPEHLFSASCVTGFLSAQNRITKNSVGLGFLGAVPEHSWIAELKNGYRAETPAVMNTSLATASLRRRGLANLKGIPPETDFVDVGEVRIFHSDYLYPQKECGEFKIRVRTVAIHHGLAQWGGPADPLPWWRKLYDLRLDRKLLRPVEAVLRKIRKSSGSTP